MPGDTTRRADAPHRTRPSRGTPTLVVSGAGERRIIKIDSDGIVIGRGEDCEVRLDDDGLSRRHARVIAASDGRIHVMDLDSTNGTFLDQERVDLRVLRAGDKIELGPSVTAVLVYPDQDEGAGMQKLLELTPRQLEVACLVAEGLTSAEVAKRIGVSTRTITSHLDRIYARLTINSRAALASRVAAAGLLTS